MTNEQKYKTAEERDELRKKDAEIAQLKARLEAVVKECEHWKWADDSWVNRETVVEDHNRCIIRIIRAARGEGGTE